MAQAGFDPLLVPPSQVPFPTLPATVPLEVPSPLSTPGHKRQAVISGPIAASARDVVSARLHSDQDEIKHLREALVASQAKNAVLEKKSRGQLWIENETSAPNVRSFTIQHAMDKTWIMDDAGRQAGLPWAIPKDLQYVSFTRLKYDSLFSSNCKAMTGLPDVTAVELFFAIVLGFSQGVLPVEYRAGRAPAGHSHISKEDHLNYMFFVLYVLRTGSNSLTLAGIMFGLEATSASRWSSYFISHSGFYFVLICS